MQRPSVLSIVMAAVLAASLIGNVILGMQRETPMKPDASALITSQPAVHIGESGQPEWWSAEINLAQRDMSIGMLASFDAQTLTIGGKPGVIYAQITREGVVTFMDDNSPGAQMPEWWQRFKQEVQARDWSYVWATAKIDILTRWATTAHTRTCDLSTSDDHTMECHDHNGKPAYNYGLPQ